MENSKQHFLEAWADTKETCIEMEALLTILKDYCEANEDEEHRIFDIRVMIELLSDKNQKQREQINQIERCSQCFIFDKL